MVLWEYKVEKRAADLKIGYYMKRRRRRSVWSASFFVCDVRIVFCELR